MHLWPEMIALELWILTLLEATRMSNLTRFDSNGRAPIATFLDLTPYWMFQKSIHLAALCSSVIIRCEMARKFQSEIVASALKFMLVKALSTLVVLI